MHMISRDHSAIAIALSNLTFGYCPKWRIWPKTKKCRIGTVGHLLTILQQKCWLRCFHELKEKELTLLECEQVECKWFIPHFNCNYYWGPDQMNLTWMDHGLVDCYQLSRNGAVKKIWALMRTSCHSCVSCSWLLQIMIIVFCWFI